jgi:hypothetical protein
MARDKNGVSESMRALRDAEGHLVSPPMPTVGAKFDEAKLPYELLPDDAIEEVVKVLQFGAKKYAPHNWEKGISLRRVYAAIRRHGVAVMRGEDNDPETGLSHWAHLMCEAMFALTYTLRQTPNTDDRKGINGI